MRRNKQKIYSDLIIINYSDEVRGIAKDNSKTIFVRGALVGEVVNAQRYKNNANFAEADVSEILKPSPLRITAKCQYFGICGGCALQHLSRENQVAIKLEIVQKMFERAGIPITQWQTPLIANEWGYRTKARLGVRFVAKKEKVLVGFREKKSSFLADMDSCLVLHPLVGQNLTTLAEMVAQLSIKEHIAQFEVAVSETASIIIIRHLEDFSAEDVEVLLSYQQQLGITFYTQRGGLDTVQPLSHPVTLSYTHPAFGLRLEFSPADFTQVNVELNQKMVVLALEWLSLSVEDDVLDLFCGLGNFTLPIATRAKSVVGIEGDKALVARAQQNAELNNIHNAQFYMADLFEEVSAFKWAKQQYNKALIDPARSGAQEIMPLLSKLGIKQLVYVSCNPHTLVRDSKILQELGYQAQQATIMDMFSHTEHIETMVLFSRK